MIRRPENGKMGTVTWTAGLWMLIDVRVGKCAAQVTGLVLI